MKKNLMNYAAGRMLFTFFLCCTMTTTVVNAQDAKSTIKKGERLAKDADYAPKDWKKHLFSTINCQRDNELKEWRMLRQYMLYRMRY